MYVFESVYVYVCTIASRFKTTPVDMQLYTVSCNENYMSQFYAGVFR